MGTGMEPGFYIEVGASGFEKKLAVTFDDVKGAWKVDTTAIQVAEGASSAISGVTKTVTNTVTTDIFSSSDLIGAGINVDFYPEKNITGDFPIYTGEQLMATGAF